MTATRTAPQAAGLIGTARPAGRLAPGLPAAGQHADHPLPLAQQPVAPRRLPWQALLAAWRQHQDLLRSASSLVATTGVTSVLGFAFWTFAARVFSQQAVGYGSAAISAMTLLGTVGMFGLGTVLMGELPRRSDRAGLVSAALLVSGLGSLLLGLGFAVVAPYFSPSFRGISGNPADAAIFGSGVALTGLTMVFDQATIGMLRGGLQLTRNLGFAIGKMAALPAVAFFLHDVLGTGITLAWVAGIAVSLVVITARLWLGGSSVLARPDWGVLRGLGRTAMAHNWLNLAIVVPWSLIPVLVTLVVSPAANAAFYAAWTLAGFLYIVPNHLSTVLFAVASADPQVIARKLRFTLRLSLIIGLPGMAVLGFGAHLALSLFGAGYARTATVPLWLLVIGYVASIPRVHYIAVCRAAGKIPRAAVVLTIAATAEVIAAAVGGKLDGLNGLSFALLAVMMAEGAVTAPAVIRAAIGHGRHRLPAAAAAQAAAAAMRAGAYAGTAAGVSAAGLAGWGRGSTPCQPRLQAFWGPEERDSPDRQESGIAALMSLAALTAPTQPIPILPAMLAQTPVPGWLPPVSDPGASSGAASTPGASGLAVSGLAAPGLAAPGLAAGPRRARARRPFTATRLQPADRLQASARTSVSGWAQTLGARVTGLNVTVSGPGGGPGGGSRAYLSWTAEGYQFRGRFRASDVGNGAGYLQVEMHDGTGWCPANTISQIDDALTGYARGDMPGWECEPDPV